MKFGKTLRLVLYTPWATKYIDYKGLKVKIKDPDVSMAAIVEDLDSQIERAEAFYKSQFEKLSLRIENQEASDIREGSDKEADRKFKDAISQSIQNLIKMTLEVSTLKEFINLNAQAVTKILKKYRKQRGATADFEALAEKSVLKLASGLMGDSKALDDMSARLQELMILLPRPVKLPKSRLDAVIETESQVVPIFESFDAEAFKVGAVTKCKFSLGTSHLAEPICIPGIILRGAFSGPTLCIASAIHGNELNGIPLIHRLAEKLDCNTLCGTVLCLPVINVPGFAQKMRNFSDGQDLNRIFPGKKDGNCGQQFVYKLMKNIIMNVNYLVDMHTASYGRENSLYIRSDMNDPICKRMSMLMNPQIVLHSTGPDSSLRGCAMENGIKAMCVEVAHSLEFHAPFIENCIQGLDNVMRFLRMIPTEELHCNAEDIVRLSNPSSPPSGLRQKRGLNSHSPRSSPLPMSPSDGTIPVGDFDTDAIVNPILMNYKLRKKIEFLADGGMGESSGSETPKGPTVCSRSYWSFTSRGGVLYVLPECNDWVLKGEVIAEVYDLYGALVDRYIAQDDGIVIGKSTNPVCQSGDRILHLGIMTNMFPAKAYDGH